MERKPRGIKFMITLEERKAIQILISQGRGVVEIARMVNRDRATIRREIAKGGGYENYDPMKANLITAQTLHGRAVKNKVIQRSLTKRVESLEMQIKLLFNQIKKLTEG